MFAADAAPYIRKAREAKLADDPQWTRLLHYNRNMWFVTRSDIDVKGFFLSPRGQSKSADEMNATIAAFFQPTADPNESARCKYPARYEWLDERLHFSSDLPPITCQRYEEWREKMNPEGVSLIFSAYYLNNPASMYGHTFLTLHRKGYGAGEGLLNYTVNYAAQTTTNNGIMFAVRGLMGGYRGGYSTNPYYMKIQQYNNMESRDLWEYELNLSQKEVDFLTKHLWELGPSTNPYFFFNKNCSYQLLPLLDSCNPRTKLARRFIFRVIPLDTLRTVLKEPNFVKSEKLRPSHTRQMLARRALLTDSEITLAENLAKSDSIAVAAKLDALPQDRQRRVLDSAHDLLRYRYGFYREQPKIFQDSERRILLKRNALPTGEETPIKYDLEPPERGHPTARASVGLGWDKYTSFEELTIRAALHDLEADPAGYIDGSQLEMIHLKFRYNNERKATYLESFTLVDIYSLSPWDRWLHPLSWRVHTGLETLDDGAGNPENRMTYNLNGGSGYTWHLFGSRSMMYVMWKGEGAIGSTFRDGYRGGVGGMTGLVIRTKGPFRLHVEAAALRFGIGDIKNEVRMSAVPSVSISRNVEARVKLERRNDQQQGLASLLYYW